MFKRTIDIDGNEVRIKGITYGEYLDIIRSKINTNAMFIYHIGYHGIEDIYPLIINEDGVMVKYDRDEHYDTIFGDNFSFVSECADKILELSVVSEEERDYIKDQCYFSDYISDDARRMDLWDCRTCCEKRLFNQRICSRFNDEELDKMRKSAKYIPHDLLTKEEIESLNEDEEIDIIVEPEEKTNKNRRSLTSKVRREREKKEEENNERQNQKYEEGHRVQYSLNTDMHTWIKCPAYNPNREIQIDLQTVFRCLGNEKLLVSGGVAEQPNRFIEMTSYVKSNQADIQEKRTDKRKKLQDKENQKRSASKGGTTPPR